MKEFWDVLSLSVDRVGQASALRAPPSHTVSSLPSCMGPRCRLLLLCAAAHADRAPSNARSCSPCLQVYISTMEAKNYPVTATQW